MPMAPDYGNPMMWHTTDGDTAGTGADVFYVVSTWETDWTTSDGQICHSADVWNVEHRRRMGVEIKRAAAYMSPGNRFYAPYYRHTIIDTWITGNEDTIHRRTRMPMKDVCDALSWDSVRADWLWWSCSSISMLTLTISWRRLTSWVTR